MRVGILQLTSSDDPAQNLEVILELMADAKAKGVDMVLTPEVSNCVSTDRARQRAILCPEQDDPTLAALRGATNGMWLLIGSLALATDDPQGRFANRSFLVDPSGAIQARYDKIHMFDVQVSEAETYRESAGFRPGTRAQVAQTPWGMLGLTICYDLRFPHLFRSLAQAGAGIITVPSAFSTVTGAAHWEPLLRARAIETGCFILAPAQVGRHAIRAGKPRQTYGHSMIVSPWGEVLLDARLVPGLHICDLNLSEITDARARIPSVLHDAPFERPAHG